MILYIDPTGEDARHAAQDCARLAAGTSDEVWVAPGGQTPPSAIERARTAGVADVTVAICNDAVISRVTYRTNSSARLAHNLASLLELPVAPYETSPICGGNRKARHSKIAVVLRLRSLPENLPRAILTAVQRSIV